MTLLTTARLKLRQWQESDRGKMAAMNASPEVMRHFPSCLSRAQSDELFDRLHSHIDEHNWGGWSVETIDTNQWVGFVGLNRPSSDLPFGPCVEIAWRLRSEYWGKGYASEAAIAAVRYGFEVVGLKEIVSFTSTTNAPSEAVMRRIGMQKTKNNFLHPDIAADSPLAEHVLYRISLKQWRAFCDKA